MPNTKCFSFEFKKLHQCIRNFRFKSYVTFFLDKHYLGLLKKQSKNTLNFFWIYDHTRELDQHHLVAIIYLYTIFYLVVNGWEVMHPFFHFAEV